VDPGFDENEAEFRVLVFAIALKMLADGDGLLDQHVQVLWNLWCKAVRSEYAQNLITGDDLGLGDSVGVSKHDTNLTRRRSLLRELADLIDHLLGRHF